MFTVSADFAGAVVVPEGEIDAGLVWHYGDPFAEQRMWLSGNANVELSNRSVLTISGSERLEYLHALTSQELNRLKAGESALTLNLSPQGFVLHEIHVVDDGTTAWLIVESETAEELLNYLLKMRFRMQLEVADVSDRWCVIAQPNAAPHDSFLSFISPFVGLGREIIVPAEQARNVMSTASVGVWAYNAMRIAAGAPRQGVETDHHTIPLELNWYPAAVHLDKGCYRGQETVSKVARMGKPPRRQTLLHLDGSVDCLPAHGTEVTHQGATVGFVGQAVQHCELGPIASAVLKRNVETSETVDVAGMRASQEVVVVA